MDPKYQVVEEPTFATTLTEVSELRRRYASKDDENDFSRYKLMFIASLRAGERMELRMTNVEVDVKERLARNSALSAVSNRVGALEEIAKERKGFAKRWGGRVWGLVVIVATVLVTRWLGR